MRIKAGCSQLSMSKSLFLFLIALTSFSAGGSGSALGQEIESAAHASSNSRSMVNLCHNHVGPYSCFQSVVVARVAFPLTFSPFLTGFSRPHFFSHHISCSKVGRYMYEQRERSLHRPCRRIQPAPSIIREVCNRRKSNLRVPSWDIAHGATHTRAQGAL